MLFCKWIKRAFRHIKTAGADKLSEKGGFPRELKHLNAQEFEAILQSGQPAMIDFSAVWCGPCQILAPVMEKLAEQYDGKAVVAKVDVDEQRELAIQYRVMSVPTVIFLKDGKEVDRKIGVREPAEYTERLDACL